MFPTAWPQALRQESARLQHWATELDENDGGGHKAEPWGTWALKRTLLNFPTSSFHQGLKNPVGERLFSKDVVS